MPIEQVRNLLLIALCVVGFLLWQAWRQDYGPQPVQRPAPTSTESTTPAPDAPPAAAAEGPSPSATDGATPTDVPGADLPREQDAREAPTTSEAPVDAVQVHTDVIEARIDLDGGGIERLLLRDYAVSTTDSTPFRLFATEPRDLFVEQSGLISKQPAPTHHARYRAAAREYRLDEGEDVLEVPLVWEGSNGLTVRKVYRFRRDSYLVGVRYEIRNDGPAPWSGRMYGQLQRTPPEPPAGLFRTYTYTGGVLSGPEKPYEKIDFDDMAKADVDRTVRGGWAAIIQHYFAGAWVPPQDEQNHYYSKALEGERYVMGVITAPVAVAPGARETLALRLYAGPKIQERLDPVAPHLERTVDYGWLWFIAEPLFWLLDHIHGFVGNWGWSIVILTFLIKLAFFHLSATSYKSMARMRKLQPRITTLRERYANDKQRMNQAMMELYKEEKINPLGGCLPILVQIPVFISLYWMLLESVELRQAPFMLWIRDLSEHDPYFVLPILMGATMLVQQKLNPAPPDPMQAKIMMALPFVFTFFFLFFPSGLVLYWFVNNVLSIIQQWVITRKIVGTG